MKGTVPCHAASDDRECDREPSPVTVAHTEVHKEPFHRYQ